MCAFTCMHTGIDQNIYTHMHICTNLCLACPQPCICTCICTHMHGLKHTHKGVSTYAHVGSLHGTHRSASEGNRATTLGEPGLSRPSPPESHFLESVSYGVSESELGAGPSGGTGRRGGCVWKAEAPNLSFKVSRRGGRSLLQSAKPKHWAIVVSSGGEELRLASPIPGFLGLSCSGMESVVQPSVFVVDGQTDIPFRRLGQNHRRQRCGIAQVNLALILMLGAGLATQGWFLLRLHQRLGDTVTRLPVRGARGSRVASPASISLRLCMRARQRSDPRASDSVFSSVCGYLIEGYECVKPGNFPGTHVHDCFY